MRLHPFRQIKWWYQRITRGYCDKDVWDIDMWFLRVVPQMLDQLRKTTNGYPTEYKSMEEWNKVLQDMASLFRLALDEESPYKRDECKNEALQMFSDNFWNLWD